MLPCFALGRDTPTLLITDTWTVNYVICLLGAFDLLAYTNRDQDIPDSWEESQARIIANSQEVRLRSFSTTVHKVDTMVSYKSDD